MPVGLNVIIDLSHHNQVVDFAKVAAAGVVGVLHKATQGTAFVDPKYAERRQQALDAGLLWGAYHYGTGADGVAQAQHFLSTASPDPSTLLVLDFEQNPDGPSMTLEQARAFVTQVQGASARWPGFYSGWYIKAQLGTQHDPLLSNCWLWLAHYVPNVPTSWATWSACTLWQYTNGSAGSEPHDVDGIGPCDRSTFQGDLAALKALWGA